MTARSFRRVARRRAAKERAETAELYMWLVRACEVAEVREASGALRQFGLTNDEIQRLSSQDKPI